MFSKKPIAAIAAVFLACGLAIFTFAHPAQARPKELDSAIDEVIVLDQGWNERLREAYYFTDEGSKLLPYDWFLVLERASSQELFRSNEHMDALRFLPSQATDANPDGLPVGFAKGVDKGGDAWVGFNCALCHTGELRYQDTTIRVDGAPTLGDLQTLQVELLETLKVTAENADKFDRFARQVLEPTSEATAAEEQPALAAEAREELRGQLFAQIAKIETYNAINYDYHDQPSYGYARVDAIGSIFNQVMTTFNDLPENARPADAPVSYPFVWGTDQSDVVQWPGFAPSGPLSFGTLLRNAGQVLGTYGEIEIPARTVPADFDSDGAKEAEELIEDLFDLRYESSLNVENLGKYEQWVADLRSPRWPEQYLPAIDTDLAQAGEGIYNRSCLGCHAIIKPADEGKTYHATLTPLAVVQTDSKELDNMARQLKAGKYEGLPQSLPELGFIGPETTGTNPLVNASVGALLGQPKASLQAGLNKSPIQILLRFNPIRAIKAFLDPKQAIQSLKADLKNARLGDFFVARKAVSEPIYKARPLNGAWATAPFLHNGSVPNLYELLLPQEQRSDVFYVGSREFDPEKVGYVANEATEGELELFRFETSLPGNSNQGHEFGLNAIETEYDRLALLEYLKTL
ncbi:MAG: di-heme-cytochrome C peroxidase [Cyanobacteria bacterium J06641_5]